MTAFLVCWFWGPLPESQAEPDLKTKQSQITQSFFFSLSERLWLISFWPRRRHTLQMASTVAWFKLCWACFIMNEVFKCEQGL